MVITRILTRQVDTSLVLYTYTCCNSSIILYTCIIICIIIFTYMYDNNVCVHCKFNIAIKFYHYQQLQLSLLTYACIIIIHNTQLVHLKCP